MPGASLKILIADDTPTNIKQLEAVIRKLGHQAIIAYDGQQAVDQYRAESPDLIFMDIMMPVMDGITAVREIRSLPSEKWSPIIFYSALDRMQNIVEGLESGADDYVVKPASLQLLRAKINAYARLLGLQKDIKKHSEELENWRADAEEQNRLGAHVMARLTEASELRDSLLHYFNIPAETFSGDLLCAAKAPGDVVNLMLADATGHGLAAALTAMPLTQVFYSMTAKGFPLASIAEELNRKLKGLLPADRFVAATLAAVDIRNQTVEVWNGGNPDAVFLNSSGVVSMNWPSRHPPLGIFPDKIFSGMTETVVFHEPGDLVLCSDGLIEAETPEGTWLGLDGVTALLAKGEHVHSDGFEFLRQGLREHLQAESGRDDISCMVMHVPIERRQQIRFAAPEMVNKNQVGDWRLDISYSAQELRYIDVVPAVLGFITQVSVLRPHQGAIFLIVSELYNNSLDHGLLGLDSAIKSWIGGFEIYMKHRSERLAGLVDGYIDLSFQLHQNNNQVVLDISIHDSGPGFNYERVIEGQAAALQDSLKSFGRGIALVRSLCSEVVYSGTGNKVWVRYVLGEVDDVEEGQQMSVDAQGGASSASEGDGGLVLF